MNTNKKRSICPVSSSLDIWGDKWSLLIIRDLMFSGECTYGDFLKSEEKISTNILAARLKHLEQHDIIKKLEHPKSKSKVLYRLTNKGVSLVPVIVEINIWWHSFNEDVSEKSELILKKVANDKLAFIENTMNKLEQLNSNNEQK